jgi:transcriptional repressor of dcmA and dcmR
MARQVETDNQQLMNIKQAARLLNVSEVSLRRWTSSGKLSCLRVGAKRERRFQRADLMAFLEEQAGGSPGLTPEAPASGATTQISLDGIAIDHGSHLCMIYENDFGRVRWSVPFLDDGLEAGGACALVADGDAQEHILDELGRLRPRLKSDIGAGRLIVSDGASSAIEMYEMAEAFLENSTRAGSQSIRILGDMAWCLSKEMALKELADFELRYNNFLARSFPVVSLCQYDARRFTGQGVLTALKCHEDNFKHPLWRFLN